MIVENSIVCWLWSRTDGTVPEEDLRFGRFRVCTAAFSIMGSLGVIYLLTELF